MLPKALIPIVVTEAGIIIEVKLLHPLNAYSPIVVTNSDNVIVVRFVQPLNV